MHILEHSHNARRGFSFCEWLNCLPVLGRNGKADIVWRSTGGDVSMWLMNGASISSGASLGVLPTTWSIVE